MSEGRGDESDEAASGSRELAQAAQILARLEKLEQHNSDLEAKLIEQEHRLLPVLRNWFSFSSHGADEPTDAVELRFWKDRRSASRWALFWRFVSPETAATAGVTVLALLGAYFAYEANGYFQEQNKKFDTQNGLVKLQNEYFREQNAKTQLQIEAQANEAYLGRRASLIGTLYDRTNCPLKSESESTATCPLRASLRAREDALGALVEIERARNPVPIMTGPAGQMAVPELSLVGLEMEEGALRGADLRHAKLVKAKLRNANLSNASLGEARLYRADLREADLSYADLREADLKRANLEEANLAGANLRGAGLMGADLRGAGLSWANLRQTNLGGARLMGAWLTWANLRQTNLRYADLSNAELRGVKLWGADLSNADFSGANLYGADLWGADLMGANLSNASLGEAKLEGAKNLTQEQVDSAVGNSKTQLPQHIKRPSHWK